MEETFIPTMIPELSIITSAEEKIVYILSKFTTLPAGISTTFYKGELSVKDLASKFGDSPSDMCKQSKIVLENTLRNILPLYEINVRCDHKYIDRENNLKYSLIIEVEAFKGSTRVSIADHVSIDSESRLVINTNRR